MTRREAVRTAVALWLVGLRTLVLACVVAVAVADEKGPFVVGDWVVRRWQVVGWLVGQGLLALFTAGAIRVGWPARPGGEGRRRLRDIGAGALACG